MTHQVTILWGEAPDPEEPNWKTYSFDTIEERNAFMMGVAEAEGWLGYESFDTPEECKARVNELRNDVCDHDFDEDDDGILVCHGCGIEGPLP